MSATDDRTFADVRPLFDAWQTAHTAAVRAADPQYEGSDNHPTGNVR